jgi:hypothetical protein
MHPAVEYLRRARLPERHVFAERVPAIVRSGEAILCAWIPCVGKNMRHVRRARHLFRL